jgi:hypothetical protein
MNAAATIITRELSLLIILFVYILIEFIDLKPAANITIVIDISKAASGQLIANS